MDTLSEARELLDALDGTPFNDLPKAFDRLAVLIARAQREREALIAGKTDNAANRSFVRRAS